MLYWAVREYTNVIQVDNDKNVYKWVQRVCRKTFKSSRRILLILLIGISLIDVDVDDATIDGD